MFRALRSLPSARMATSRAGLMLRRPLSTGGAPEFTEASVAANGVNLHCVTNGTAGTPVLCMPGALGTALTDFDAQLRGLAGAHRVVSFDPRGYGKV